MRLPKKTATHSERCRKTSAVASLSIPLSAIARTFNDLLVVVGNTTWEVMNARKKLKVVWEQISETKEPASGYSYLELYLMGLIAAAEVPDFFIVRPLARIGTDANGRPIFKGQRMRITIQDVIAAEGPRLPDVNHSQRHFNTGIVVIVEHGRKPSAELINQANGIPTTVDRLLGHHDGDVVRR